MTRTFRAARPRRLFWLSLVAAVVSGCGILGPSGGVPREPFEDIAVPPAFLPFSNDWTLIQSGRVTAARMVYQTELPVEGAATELAASLKDRGWVLKGAEPMERAGFAGKALSFVKGPDACRAELVSSTTTTRVDLIVARVGDAR